jgi:phosphoserine phosphatase RsbU/P
MSKRVRILVGSILLALMTANLGAIIYSMFTPPKGSEDGFSATWDLKGEPRITSVDPNGPAKELQVGDEWIAIDGVKIREDPGVLGRDDPPGTRVTLTIRRAGELRDVVIQTVPYQFRLKFDPVIPIIILFLLTGWAVFVLRPDDEQSWLLALMLGTMTGLMGGSPPTNLPLWLSLIAGSSRALGTLFLPIFVHFFLIFPGRSPLLRRWPRLELYLYIPYLLMILPIFGPIRFSSDLGLWLWRFQWAAQKMTSFGLFMFAAYLAGGLVCLVINYRAASLVDRRKLRVVMTGSAAGIFNLFLIVVWEVTGVNKRMEILSSWVEWATLFTFPLIPLSFAYAIIRHKVIPVGLIIRRGLRYLFVSRGSVLLLIAVVSVAVFFVMDAFFNYLRPRSGRTVGIISALVAIVVWQLARAFHLRVVAPKVDKLFFHQAYDAHQIMADLAESLRTTTSLPRLLELVATKIQSALHAANVIIFLRDETSGDYPCAYSCEYSYHNRSAMWSPCHYRFSRDSAIIRWLTESSQPIDLDGRDPQFSLQPENSTSSKLSSEEREVLEKLNSALLLPFVGKEGLLGVISLGSHLGDLPFTSEDKKLLLSVSGPTSFALENARLIERTIEEARLRQELQVENEQRARELEEARQLQLSMLPKTVPQLPHLEIAAFMKPATEVGGDYYDFHLAEDGTLTMVVGDATGHGLKAGTVVTATKSLFNHLASNPDIVGILHQSSLALKQMNLRSLYMALTMAKIKGYCLALSAAGMPPVLIYRAETKRVEELLIRGVPLGSVTSYQYRQHEVMLSRGDIVVLMSDGFPERFNLQSEILDYSKAKDVLAEVANRSPQGIIEHFIEVGEDWANGRPQDDDITFVVLKTR